MKIYLDKQFTNAKGKELVGDQNNMSEFLAFVIANSQGKDVRKFWNWCTIFSKKEVLEIDKTDFDKLVTFITDNKLSIMNYLTQGQLIDEILYQKENQKEVEKLIEDSNEEEDKEEDSQETEDDTDKKEEDKNEDIKGDEKSSTESSGVSSY